MNLKSPDFGTPKDNIERAAHKWLTENLGREGSSIMQSLANVIRSFVENGIDNKYDRDNGGA